MNKVFGKKTDFSHIREDASRVIVSYGYQEVDDENATWFELYFYKKKVSQVSLADVEKAVIADINAQTDERILSGFAWNGKPVWLSTENQFNFKAAYDVAIQTDGENLPVKFKLGEDEEGHPVYHTFDAQNAFNDFYTKAIAYINQCLNDGWTRKDAIDWTPYESHFPEPSNGQGS